MRRFLVLTVVGLAGVAFAGDKPSADVMGRWVGGKWVLESHALDTDYSKAGSGSGVSTCAWSPDHVFVVCDQDVKDGGQAMRFLSIYSFDPASGSYHFFGISPEGGRPHAGDVAVSENGAHWEYLTKTTVKEKPVWFRTVNQFKNADEVDWWSEYSTDEGKHWTKTGGGTEKREK